MNRPVMMYLGGFARIGGIEALRATSSWPSRRTIPRASWSSGAGRSRQRPAPGHRRLRGDDHRLALALGLRLGRAGLGATRARAGRGAPRRHCGFQASAAGGGSLRCCAAPRTPAGAASPSS
ncbi:MAG: hypothetical protein WDO13_19335 [Verrucomicrobiota bacterium]